MFFVFVVVCHFLCVVFLLVVSCSLFVDRCLLFVVRCVLLLYVVGYWLLLGYVAVCCLLRVVFSLIEGVVVVWLIADC